MEKYKNPIPSLDDEPQSCTVELRFSFDGPVTREEAARNLTEFFTVNDVKPNQIILTGQVGIRYKEKQDRLRACDSDPLGDGPR